MKIPDDLKYSKEHEWVRLEGDEAVVGITDFAQNSLGDVVYVQMPEVGSTVSAGDAVAEVESVKAVSDVYAPLSGEIVAVNEELDGQEELVNQDPYGAAWLFRIKPADLAELDGLLDAEAYRAMVAEQE